MNWKKVKLSDVADTGSGGTPLRAKSNEYYNGNIPWVKSGELKSNIILKTEEYINEKAIRESSSKLVPINSILVALYGATVGNTAILGIDAATNQAVCFIIPQKGKIESKYIFYLLKSKINELLSMRVGGAQPNISQEIIKNLTFPLPPLSEQNKIIEILEQADELRKRKKEVIEKSDKIITSLFYKMFGDPIESKELISLESLIEQIERRNPTIKSEEEFKYVDISGVDGIKGEIVNVKTISGNDAPSRARQVIKSKDVIISTVRPYLRATALVSENLDNQICSTGFCVLRAKNNTGYGFIYALSRLQWFTQRLNDLAKGASYPAVSDQDILTLEIPKPNIKMLKKFDTIVDHVQTINQNYQESFQKIELLFQSIQHRAFSGELTNKWREENKDKLNAEIEERKLTFGF
jgi:type I restriction enzyme S subunit